MGILENLTTPGNEKTQIKIFSISKLNQMSTEFSLGHFLPEASFSLNDPGNYEIMSPTTFAREGNGVKKPKGFKYFKSTDILF